MRKLIYKIKLFFVGLFYGLKSADVTMLHQDDNDGDESKIDQQMKIDNVMSDFLNEQETQRVIETRDAYYRLLFEADKYSVDMQFNEEGELTGAKAYRNNGKWITPPDTIDTSDGLKVRVIQENECIPKESHVLISPEYAQTKHIYQTMYKELMSKSINDYIMLIELDYGDITPKYPAHKFLKKIVVKGKPEETYLDLYFGKYQEQFNKLHALFLSELNRIMTIDGYKSDITEIKRLGFVTNGRAWGASPAAVFSFKDIEYESMHEFDGNFIMRFKCKTIKDGENVGEKFHTKELDEKYAVKAKKDNGKSDTYSFDAAVENMNNTLNLKTEKLKLLDNGDKQG